MERETETLCIVVPCYNEEEALPETAKRLKEKLLALIEGGRIARASTVLFVDDGSTDGTWAEITALHEESVVFRGLKLSRNRGHQNALFAGLMAAKEQADIVLSIDADLQDDLAVLDAFLFKRREGCDIVYGVRSERKTDTAFKRGTAVGFYKLMKRLGVESIPNHADCRLMSRRALSALESFEEVNLYLRGLVPLLGFKSSVVEYARSERLAGKSKYPLQKMLALASDGITSFSVKPLRLIAALGVLLFSAGALALLVLLILSLSGHTVSGSAAVGVSVWAACGLQLAGLGVVGEYVGKIYTEVKHRPRYIIEQILK